MTRISVRVEGIEPLLAAMKKLTPEENKKILTRSLLDCAHLVLENSKRKQFIAGGTGRKKGPRGGKVLYQKAPDPHRLTSRTGRLRDSIAVDRSPLPFSIDVGTDVVYGRVHELGIHPMPRRAFLQPAIESEEDRFPAIFMKNWRKYSGE